MVSVARKYSESPDFSNLQGNRKLVPEKSGVRNIGGKITVKQIQGKRLLVRVIGVFEIQGSRNRDSTVIYFYV